MPSLPLNLDSDSEGGTPSPPTPVLPSDAAPPSPIVASPLSPPTPPSASSLPGLLTKSNPSPVPSPTLPLALLSSTDLAQADSESPVKEALRELKAPTPPFWIGDTNTIFRNCEWAESAVGSSSFLKWKANASGRPEGSNEVMVGWIGEVSGDVSSLRADGGWKAPNFREEGAPKHKRTIYLVKPSFGDASLAAAWEAQLKGAKALVDNGRRTRTGSSIAVGFCFLDEEMGQLKARSPMFKKPIESEDTDDADPFHHCYATWEFSSPAVRAVLDRVVAQGYMPQALEAYDEFDNHIHPNDVEKLLPGSIVCVFATLERMLFTGPKQPGRRAWQFYANMVKVQILQRCPPPKPSVSKRKLDQIPSFGAKRRREALDI